MFDLYLLEIKHETRDRQEENLFIIIFIHKTYKEKIIKGKTVNLPMKKNEKSSRKTYTENCNNKTLMKIELMVDVYAYRRIFYMKINSMVPFYGQP